ncbi:hypothetical protein BGZ79_004562, partial [Entomortierella chlamydospora]
MKSEPWSVRLVHVFSPIPTDGDEKLWYAPYCAPLSSVFPLNEGYLVAPVKYPVHNDQSIDFGVQYLVENEEGVPILGLEVKKVAEIDFTYARGSVDRQ